MSGAAGDEAVAGEQASGGPPAHWLEKVRRGAPHLRRPTGRPGGEIRPVLAGKPTRSASPSPTGSPALPAKIAQPASGERPLLAPPPAATDGGALAWPPIRAGQTVKRALAPRLLPPPQAHAERTQAKRVPPSRPAGSVRSAEAESALATAPASVKPASDFVRKTGVESRPRLSAPRTKPVVEVPPVAPVAAPLSVAEKPDDAHPPVPGPASPAPEKARARAVGRELSTLSESPVRPPNQPRAEAEGRPPIVRRRLVLEAETPLAPRQTPAPTTQRSDFPERRTSREAPTQEKRQELARLAPPPRLAETPTPPRDSSDRWPALPPAPAPDPGDDALSAWHEQERRRYLAEEQEGIYGSRRIPH